MNPASYTVAVECRSFTATATRCGSSVRASRRQGFSQLLRNRAPGIPKGSHGLRAFTALKRCLVVQTQFDNQTPRSRVQKLEGGDFPGGGGGDHDVDVSSERSAAASDSDGPTLASVTMGELNIEGGGKGAGGAADGCKSRWDNLKPDDMAREMLLYAIKTRVIT